MPLSTDEPRDEPDSAETGLLEAGAEWRDERRRLEVAQTLEALYETRGPELFGYLRLLGAGPQVARDVLHEAFVKMGRHLLRKPVDDLAPYLFIVVRNTWIDWLRKADQQRVQLEGDPDKERADPAGEEAFEKVIDDYDRRAEFQAVREALRQLSPRQREIIVLHDVIGISTGEIGESLRLTEGAVRYHLSVARRRLKELLNLGGIDEKGEDQ